MTDPGRSGGGQRGGGRTRSLATGLIVAIAALLVAASAAVGAPRGLETGVSYSYSPAPVAFAHVAATGSSLVQRPLRWAQVAPLERPAAWNPGDPADPNYDWGDLDVWVSNAVAAGLTPVLQIRSAPKWAERCNAVFSDATCEPDPDALAAFATAAARRYSGQFRGLPRVRYWQGLNEPNLALFFEPQFVDGVAVAADLYRPLINRFYAAVKAVDPTNLVLAAGLGPIAVPGYTIGPMAFTRSLLCMSGGRKPRPQPGDCEGGVHFDIYDIHPYTTGGPTHRGGPNDVQLGDLGKLQRLLAAADRAGRIVNSSKRTPLWATEFAWDSKPPDPGGVPPRIMRQWVAEALHNAWRANVQAFFWFRLDDAEPEPGVPFNVSEESGLYYWNASIAAERPKPGMYAFRFPFVAIRRGAKLEYWGRTPAGRGGRVALQVRRGKRFRTLRTVRANSAGIFRGRIATHYGRNRKGAVRARFRGVNAPPFPMRRVGDYWQPPFGGA